MGPHHNAPFIIYSSNETLNQNCLKQAGDVHNVLLLMEYHASCIIYPAMIKSYLHRRKHSICCALAATAVYRNQMIK